MNLNRSLSSLNYREPSVDKITVNKNLLKVNNQQTEEA